MTRKAIVTGTSRGLGKALASELEVRGWEVLGISRSGPEVLDLADPAALNAWLAGPRLREFLADANEVVLINNAGTLGPSAPAGQQDPSLVAAAIAVNVTAPILISNAVIAARPEGAVLRIAHVSSGAGRRPIPGWSLYCATKAAVDQHASTVAAENTAGVRIAAIAPGVVDTDMQHEIRESGAFPGRDDFVAMKRDGLLLTPEESARRFVEIVLSDSFGERTLDRV